MSIFNRFRKLHWKLTLSYTFASTALFSLITLIVMVIGIFVVSTYSSFGEIIVRSIITPLSVEVRPYLEVPDPVGLERYIDSLIVNETVTVELEGGVKMALDHTEFVAVLDDAGSFLTVEWAGSASEFPLFTASEQEVVERALDNTLILEELTLIDKEKGVIFMAFPVNSDKDERLLGIIIIRMQDAASVDALITSGLRSFPVFILMTLVMALAIGTFTTFFAARSITKRLTKVADSAEAWALGDFSVKIHDESQDEIGQLARTLNSMSEQLRTLIDTRSQLATVEERNRLARDLHDAAKQQIFATTMQLSTAKYLIDQDPAAAKTHLVEAEMLAKQVQSELSGLIQELRPAQLAGKGLFTAAQDAAIDFTRRNGIPVEHHFQGNRELPLAVEQTFYRVLQESFNNITKHSRAKHVALHLTATNNDLKLTIHDDGVGFDPLTVSKGMGLHSMAERMATIDGEILIESHKNNGTTITATCPIPSTAAYNGK